MREPPRHESLSRHRDVLLEANTFAATMAAFDHVVRGLDVSRWLALKQVRSGANAVGGLVEAYAYESGGSEYFADRRVFNPPTPEFSDRFYASVWTLTAALVGAGPTGGIDIDAALGLIFGGDPISQIFGAALAGDPVDPSSGLVPIPDVPPGDRIPRETLNEIGCFIGLQDAFLGVARAVAGVSRTKPYPGMTIKSLRAVMGRCAGDVLEVVGDFPVAQPADAVVVFGSVRADVIPGSWSRSGFSVRIPPGASDCCVSVLQVPEPNAGGETVAGAVATLGAFLSDPACFGGAGVAAGIRYERLANHAPDSEQAVCAPDGSNRFVGGPPRIEYLRTQVGSASPQKLPPGQPLELDWAIVNATSATLRITTDAMTSPLAVVPSLPSWFVASPTTGRAVVSTTTGLVPWNVIVELKATNACGSKTETLHVGYDPAPGLVFVGGGARSSFDLGAIEALGALLPSSPSVCGGSGLGALSAACAAADYPNPASLRAFWTGLTDPEDWYTQNAALFVPGGDYAALDQAEWQARARAEVLTMDALGLLRSFMVPYRPGDARYVESIIVDIAGVGADKIADALGSAVETALEEAGQAVLSYVPIVAIVYAAAKFGIQELQSALRQQTADRLAATAAIFDDSGLRALITTATNGLQGRVQASGRRLRVSLTNLEKGRALYGTEGGGVSEAPIGSQIRAIANIATVVQTSATAPFLSAPRSLGGDSYVDGALRDPVPVGAVVEAGAGSVIIVQPHIRLIAELPSFATAGVPTIDARTSVVRDADSLDGRVNPFGNFANDSTGAPVGSWRVPTFLIEPTVDIVGLGATLGQAGLVDIMSDYGYMRAYDALVPWLLFPRPAQRADRDEMRSTLMTSGDHIVGLRVKAWGLEHDFNGMRPTPFGSTNRIGAGPLVADPDPSALDAIRTTKLDIRAAVVDRLGILARYEGRAPQVPAGTITAPPVPRPRAESWVQMWEKHDFFLVVAPVPPTPAEPDGDPWVSLGYGGLWTEPAAARPALIWP